MSLRAGPTTSPGGAPGAVRSGPIGVLLVVGITWGGATPLWKIAAETELSALGLTLWQAAIGICVLIPICALRRLWPPLGPTHLRYYAGLATIGVLLPNTLYYIALRDIAAGVAAIIIATVPMLSLLLASLLGLDRASPRRLTGVGMGFLAILLILAPDLSLSLGPALPLGLALLGALSYAAEGSFIALRAPQGLDPGAALVGALVAALVLGVPVAAVSGQLVSPLRPWGAGEWALTAVAIVSAFAYAGYVWLVGRAGPVFAAQVGYVITLTGVFWSMLILDERYPATVWLALILMLAGLALVSPRRPPQG
ncbi:MAG: DMT family transporter [Pseudomonadota bacterium]